MNRQSIVGRLLLRSICIGVFLMGIAVARGFSQSPTVKAFTAEQEGARKQSLCIRSNTTHTAAVDNLANYPSYYTSLICRTQSGEVEIHQKFDEVMIILEGKATLITGGTAQNVRTLPQRPGELRGVSIQGGSPTPIERGAVIHISVNTPHQVFVPDGGSVSYVDVKIAHLEP